MDYHFLVLAWHNVYAKFNPYILTLYSHSVHKNFKFFYTFAYSLMSSIYIRWLVFPCDLLSLSSAVHFLSIWLNGIMEIINSKSDRTSWNIPLWIFTLPKPFPLPLISSFQFFMIFLIKFDFIWYFEHFEALYYPAFSDHTICVFVVNPVDNYIFSVWSCSRWGYAALCTVTLLCLWILFCPSGTNKQLVSE